MSEERRKQVGDPDPGALEEDVPDYPRVREDVVFRPLAGDWVVFDPDGRRLHVMNLTAALVWSYCDGTRDHDEIVREVRAAFPETPPAGQVETDVAEALGTFADQDLLVDADAEDGTES